MRQVNALYLRQTPKRIRTDQIEVNNFIAHSLVRLTISNTT